MECPTCSLPLSPARAHDQRQFPAQLLALTPSPAWKETRLEPPPQAILPLSWVLHRVLSACEVFWGLQREDTWQGEDEAFHKHPILAEPDPGGGPALCVLPREP